MSELVVVEVKGGYAYNIVKGVSSFAVIANGHRIKHSDGIYICEVIKSLYSRKNKSKEVNLLTDPVKVLDVSDEIDILHAAYATNRGLKLVLGSQLRLLNKSQESILNMAYLNREFGIQSSRLNVRGICNSKSIWDSNTEYSKLLSNYLVNKADVLETMEDYKSLKYIERA